MQLIAVVDIVDVSIAICDAVLSVTDFIVVFGGVMMVLRVTVWLVM